MVLITLPNQNNAYTLTGLQKPHISKNNKNNMPPARLEHATSALREPRSTIGAKEAFVVI